MVEVLTISHQIIYKDFNIIHSVGDLPTLILIFELKLDILEAQYCYIPFLEWEVNLHSTSSSENSGMSKYGFWGLFESFGPRTLIKEKKSSDIYIKIPMNSQKIQQLIDIRSKNKFPRLVINVSGNYLLFELRENLYPLQSSIPFDNIQVEMHHKGSTTKHITFLSEDLIKILKQLGQYELLRIEVPIRAEGKPSNKLIFEVAEILDIAKKDLYDGNYDGVLKGVRDSLADRILMKDPETDRWILNSIIEEDFMKNAPSTAKEEYAEFIKRIGILLHSQLQIINNVYMHKKKPRVTPRPIDAEQIYLITAQLVRYLSISCNLA